MSDRPTPETDALECAFALLKCSPIGSTENSSEYGRAAYRLSKHCQGKEDVSEAAMRIFAERIAELERERDEARKMLVRSNHFLQQTEENLESIYKERDEWKNKAYSHATDYTLMEAKCFRLEQQLKEYDKLKS